MRLAPLVVGLILLGGAELGAAQNDSTAMADGSPADGPAVESDRAATEPAPVPFGVGERLRYRVKFGPLEVGAAELHVLGIDTVDGRPTYHIRYYMGGRTFFYRLRYVEDSWLDVVLLASRRFKQDHDENGRERHRVYEIDLENRVYTRNDGVTDSVPSRPLDEASFVYFVRTVPLEVGRTYEWNRYFRLERNPVIVKILRREQVSVPAGEFETLVVRPIIKTGGIFSKGGEAEVFLTDDDRKLPVQLVSKLKVGKVTLELIEYTAGEPLTSAMLSDAPASPGS